MQTLTVAPGRGWRWLTEGFALFRRNPPALAMLIILNWVLLILVNSLPYVGPVLAPLAMPAFSVGIMNACRAIDRGALQAGNGAVGASFLFSAFRPNPAPLFMLGALYLGLTLLILAASALLDGGTLMQFMFGNISAKEAFESPSLLVATQFALLLSIPVLMAYWYAPLLVAWHGFSPGKALFFSFFACLRNWRPFLAYGVSLVVWCVVLPVLLVGIITGIFSGSHFVVMLLSAPLFLVLAPTVFASFYLSYRDVFAINDNVDILA